MNLGSIDTLDPDFLAVDPERVAVDDTTDALA